MEQKKFRLKTTYAKLLADTVTPVSIYLKIRDKFANSILLESSDYHGVENSFSYICCNPVAGFVVEGDDLSLKFPDTSEQTIKLQDKRQVLTYLQQFAQSFEIEKNDFKFINNGLFGYLSYDAVQYFEDIDFSSSKNFAFRIPEIQYHVYQFVIAVDHFKNALYIFEHTYDNGSDQKSRIEEIQSLIFNKNFAEYDFFCQGEESSNVTDQEFLEVIKQCQSHCFRGDVFQIVPSRQFQRSFKGDEFQVYRVLRSINPSPYLFYFDYGQFKIFGSSPEAQIVIKNKEASIHPIAGTFLRTGNDELDAKKAAELYDDPKENSEHVMLVDLARNDLSRNSETVKVEKFKEIQFYSHVIHLVSKVTGKLTDKANPVKIVGDTFPAGTLSGAPKHMAMQLINKYENVRRGFYGGAIGFMGFNGDFNHAIMIRSFLSKNNTLYYRAGMGVVAKSQPESELQEVNNKLAALRLAIKMAGEH